MLLIHEKLNHAKLEILKLIFRPLKWFKVSKFGEKVQFLKYLNVKRTIWLEGYQNGNHT